MLGLNNRRAAEALARRVSKPGDLAKPRVHTAPCNE